MNRRTLLLVLLFAFAAAAPALGRALRDGDHERCAEDGARYAPRRVVVVLEADGTKRRLCGVECLERRLARPARAAPERVIVLDADDGTPLDAEQAWFVRSVVVDPATGGRTHAFATEAAARRHAAAFHGRVLPGPGLPALRAARRSR